MFIKRAAILFQKGGIVQGQDYNQILGIAHRFGFSGTYVSGWLDSSDNFVGGDVALQIAKDAGQVAPDHVKLYPEDLWGDMERESVVD